MLALILLGVGLVSVVGGLVLIVLAVRPGRDGPAYGSQRSLHSTPGLPAVVLRAQLAPDLSRWRWLVKWFLAIPHVVVLLCLWPVFVALTTFAFLAIVVTGRYPRALFDVNVGVLRWSWRVSYYASTGGIGTDRYPPFTLGPVPDYPATLDIAYPEHLSRGFVLVKSWLLALPHYLVIGFLVTGGGPGLRSAAATNGRTGRAPASSTS